MTGEHLKHTMKGLGIMSALLIAAAGLTACSAEDRDADDTDEQDVGEAASAIGITGGNNYPPGAVDSDPLSWAATEPPGVTAPGLRDPLPLCAGGTVTSGGCVLKDQWVAWMAADPDNRAPTMTAIAKCAVGKNFTIQTPDSTKLFTGQWNIYPTWKTNRLAGQDKHERMSSCILTLLNGNNVELQLCIIGPGGSPFSDACTSPLLTTREGGFFGDLFAEQPTAYVAGPDTDQAPTNGRACFASSGTYCCAEDDLNCAHRIVLAGAILGSPDQGFANKRCNGSLVMAGSNEYCTSYFSTRELGRSYTNVFTTFIPPPN